MCIRDRCKRQEIANQTRRGALVGQGRGGVTCRSVVIEQSPNKEVKKKKKIFTQSFLARRTKVGGIDTWRRFE